MAQLVVEFESEALFAITLEPGREYFIGRSSQTDIVLSDTSVSRHHAMLFQQLGEWTIENQSKTNRTYVNGKPIDRIALHDGDHATIGRYTVKFHEFADTASFSSENTSTEARSAAVASQKTTVIGMDEFIQGEDNPFEKTSMMQGKQLEMIRQQIRERAKPHFQALTYMEKYRYLMEKDQMVLGSDPSADLHFEGGKFLKEIEIVVKRAENGYTVEHRKGLGSLYVNDEKVGKNDVHELKGGDVLKIGPHKLKFVVAGAK